MAFPSYFKSAVVFFLFEMCLPLIIKAQLPLCKDSFPASLLPNSSFEQYSGCNLNYIGNEGGYIDSPPEYSGVTVNNWHSYLYLGYPYYRNYNCKWNNAESIFDTSSFFTNGAVYPAVHLPLPDSFGFIQIEQRFAEITDNHKIKVYNTYITTCLSTPLYAGQPYVFSFYFGFGKEKSNYLTVPFGSANPINIAIFGRQDCPDFPVRKSNYGCLTKDSGWIQLGVVTLQGKYGWVQGVIEFTPTVPITSIGIGPDCKFDELNNYILAGTHQFYYMDKFILAPKKDFSFKQITAVAGNACTGGFVLQAPTYPVAAYQWYKNDTLITGAASQLYTVPNQPNAAGNYTANIQLPYNTCLNTLPYTVAFSDIDKLSLGKDTILCAPATLNLHAASATAQQYVWQDGSTQPNLAVNTTGTYWVQATDVYGCTKRDSINVIIEGCDECAIFTPSAFTPNNDGLNDVFKPVPQCANIGFTHYNMRIYNRWGQIVFTSNDIYKGWDGMNNHQPLETGVYMYVLNYAYKSNKPLIKKGTIVLLI